jgi:catechol 2,3-dioxygenase-like lactoylglutathione lyase family enzyme
VEPKTLDHVAFWVTERRRIADFLERYLGMHVITEEANFSLMGSHARHGKLTLFDAEGPRDRGALDYVALRVSDLTAARAELPPGSGDVIELDDGVIELDDGVRIALVQAPTEIEYDLDHVMLLTADPAETARAYERYGFDRAGETRVEVGGAYVEFRQGEPATTDRPLLNHLAVLVDSADEVIADAGELGIEVESVVDAANTYAAFLWGPDRVRIEYVEHKPTFSLT